MELKLESVLEKLEQSKNNPYQIRVIFSFLISSPSSNTHYNQSFFNLSASSFILLIEFKYSLSIGLNSFI